MVTKLETKLEKEGLLKEETEKNSGTLTIGILGVKGGVGASTFTLNLAAQLAAGNNLPVTPGCLLLDANLQQPDLALLLNLKPRFSISDLIPRLDSLSVELLSSCLTESAGVSLLTASANISEALTVSPDALSRLLCAIKGLRGLPVGLVDLPKTLDQNLLAMLDNLDHLILVMEATVPALAATGKWLSILSDLGIDKDRLTLVLNRAGGKMKDVEKQLLALTARSQSHNIFKVPNAYEEAENAAIEGLPLVLRTSRSTYARSIAVICRHLAENPVLKEGLCRI